MLKLSFSWQFSSSHNLPTHSKNFISLKDMMIHQPQIFRKDFQKIHQRSQCFLAEWSCNKWCLHHLSFGAHRNLFRYPWRLKRLQIFLGWTSFMAANGIATLTGGPTNIRYKDIQPWSTREPIFFGHKKILCFFSHQPPENLEIQGDHGNSTVDLICLLKLFYGVWGILRPSCLIRGLSIRLTSPFYLAGCIWIGYMF